MLRTELEVIGFSVVDSVNGRYLFDLNDGDTLDMDALEDTYGVDQFTIVCNTTGPVESALLTDPYDETANVEGSPPWALASDVQGNFGTTPFRDNLGNWTVTCEPFCGPDNMGDSGEVAEVNFDVKACTECTTECIRVTGKSYFRMTVSLITTIPLYSPL